MRISDWSSDVCSSDLLRLSPGLSGGAILSRSEGLPDLRGDREYPAHDHRAQDSRLSAALPGDIAGPTIEQPSVWYFRYRRAAHVLSVPFLSTAYAGCSHRKTVGEGRRV